MTKREPSSLMIGANSTTPSVCAPAPSGTEGTVDHGGPPRDDRASSGKLNRRYVSNGLERPRPTAMTCCHDCRKVACRLVVFLGGGWFEEVVPANIVTNEKG